MDVVAERRGPVKEDAGLPRPLYFGAQLFREKGPGSRGPARDQEGLGSDSPDSPDGGSWPFVELFVKKMG